MINLFAGENLSDLTALEIAASILGVFIGAAIDPLKIGLGIGLGALTYSKSVLVWGPLAMAMGNQFLVSWISKSDVVSIWMLVVSVMAFSLWISIGVFARRFRNRFE